MCSSDLDAREIDIHAGGEMIEGWRRRTVEREKLGKSERLNKVDGFQKATRGRPGLGDGPGVSDGTRGPVCSAWPSEGERIRGVYKVGQQLSCLSLHAHKHTHTHTLFWRA